MDDLVERLRKMDPRDTPSFAEEILVEAAVEIERLRSALKKIASTENSVARSSIREYAASILQPLT